MSTTPEHLDSVLAETERRKNPFALLPVFLVLFENPCNVFLFFDALSFTSATDLHKQNARDCVLAGEKYSLDVHFSVRFFEIKRALG